VSFSPTLPVVSLPSIHSFLYSCAITILPYHKFPGRFIPDFLCGGRTVQIVENGLPGILTSIVRLFVVWAVFLLHCVLTILLTILGGLFSDCVSILDYSPCAWSECNLVLMCVACLVTNSGS